MIVLAYLDTGSGTVSCHRVECPCGGKTVCRTYNRQTPHCRTARCSRNCVPWLLCCIICILPGQRKLPPRAGGWRQSAGPTSPIENKHWALDIYVACNLYQVQGVRRRLVAWSAHIYTTDNLAWVVFTCLHSNSTRHRNCAVSWITCSKGTR
jgi:hypothetical protein